jgi:hypothetical protein
MVSIYQNSNTITSNEGEVKALEFRGLSTDTKPTTLDNEDIANGSVFIEIDTGKIFFYDLENEEWKEA